MSSPAIVFVLPFARLAETALAVAAELEVTVHVEVGDLDKGVARALAAQAAGAEVIISRGGTACVIAAAVSIPVVEVRVTSSDVLRSLSSVASYRGKVGLAGFRNIIYGCEEIGGYLGLEMVQVAIPDQASALAAIARAQAAGVGHVIGDHISYICARELGLPATLIESGREGFAQALFEAQNVLKVRREERAKAQQVRTILDSVRDGILATDAAGKVILSNPRAEQLLGRRSGDLAGMDVAELLPGIPVTDMLQDGRSQVGVAFPVGEARLAVTRAPVRVAEQTVGAVITFHDVTELQRYEQIVRQKLHRKGLVARSSLEQIMGHSPAITRVTTEARRYAHSDATVLILGESGTGKELAAQGIHRASARHQGPFVAVNCASMPEALLQSELFGYEEGAFTGARRGGKQGLFELAHGGTILLDEIGELPLSLQGHLLRVLQAKEVMRVGGDSIIPVDVRVVAATNRSLEEEVAAGRFRADLFYRLNVLRLELPPLRTRLEDLPELAGALLERLRQKYGERRHLTAGALDALMGHSWPGNVRELENTLERLWVVTDGPLIERSMVLAHLPAQVAAPPEGGGLPWPEQATLADIELLAIRHAVDVAGGNLERAAERLGIHRSTLYRKLQRDKQNATS